MSAQPIPSSPARHDFPWLAGLVVAIVAAYSGMLQAPFVYDDVLAIPDNATIRHLWPISRVLWPQVQGGLTVAGRPVLNLSFAINHAISGPAVWSYHVFNLLVHIGSALLVYGIVRHTVERAARTSTLSAAGVATRPVDASRIALAIAAVWGLHPLQTQAVTYTVQRAESLMGFFYLLTLYAFIRAVTEPVEPATRRWFTVSVAACALGMGTKEVAATAPLLVLLYDRTFVAGKFRSALRARLPYYLALTATWGFLAALVMSTGGNRGGTVGVGVGIPLWAYPFTQFQAVARYLALSIWPQPLVFEYGTFWLRHIADVLPDALIIVPLLAAAVIAIRRWPAIGFCGAWFFLILAPTSLAPGTIQMIVEHRMYLPLASVVALLVFGLKVVAGRATPVIAFALAAAMGVATARRNHDYRSHLALWTDTVAKRPLNARAHQGLAEAFAELGQDERALQEFAVTVELQPAEFMYHHNLALAMAKSGQLDGAIKHYEESLRLAPNEPRTHNNLAIALGLSGRDVEAFPHYAAAERLAPHDPQYPFNHGIALFRAGRTADAIAHYRMALQLRPDHADAHFNLATALATTGQLEEALHHYQQALQLDPDASDARASYGDALLLANRPADALEQFQAILRRAPKHVEARYGAANALARLRRLNEAVAAYETLLRDDPAHADAHYKLANVLIDLDRVPEATQHYEDAIRLKPEDAEAHHNLGIAFARRERWTDARREFETALRLKPDYPEARQHLEQVRALQGR